MKRGMPGGVNPFPVAVKLDGDSMEGAGAAAESVQQQEAQHAQEFGDSGLDTRRGVHAEGRNLMILHSMFMSRQLPLTTEQQQLLLWCGRASVPAACHKMVILAS